MLHQLLELFVARSCVSLSVFRKSIIYSAFLARHVPIAGMYCRCAGHLKLVWQKLYVICMYVCMYEMYVCMYVHAHTCAAKKLYAVWAL